MKIRMVTRWNVPCGVGLHGELIERAWVEMGHKVKIFALKEWKDPYTVKDEPYVMRCYGKDEQGQEFFDKKLFFQEDLDVFVVQTEIIEDKQLMKVYPEIKRKAKTVFINHDQ